MVKILLNPEFFPDYNKETKKSEIAENTFFIVGPSSVSFEKAFVPYNTGKYGARNQRELDKYHCTGATVPVWATLSGMWFDDDEFDIVAASEVYPNLIMNVTAGKIIVEKDGNALTASELVSMSGGSGGGGGDIDANVITY